MSAEENSKDSRLPPEKDNDTLLFILFNIFATLALYSILSFHRQSECFLQHSTLITILYLIKFYFLFQLLVQHFIYAVVFHGFLYLLYLTCIQYL